MKPQDLYQRIPESSDHNLFHLKGFYYNHLPEIQFDFPWVDGQQADPGKRVAIHYYKNFCFDGRRVWILASVFFDGEPVMITQNAGREGDDHAARFVTDKDRYRQMIIYLNTLNPMISEEENKDFVEINQDIVGLDEFYGNKLDGYFERYRY